MIEFRVLGRFEVVDHDSPLALGGPKQRALLAVLLLHRGQPVSSDRLIDELWGERAPPSANKIVQGHVSDLRKVLGDGLLITQGRGYLLVTGPGQTDLDRFEALVAKGRRALEGGDALTAGAVLREALGLWRGPALADFAYEPFAQSEIARWRNPGWRCSRTGSTPIWPRAKMPGWWVSSTHWCASIRCASASRPS